MCLQDNTPKPTKDVYLHTTPAATFFVSQFGGFAVDDITVSAKAAALVSKLKARGENFVESVFFSGAALLVIFTRWPKTSSDKHRMGLTGCGVEHSGVSVQCDFHTSDVVLLSPAAAGYDPPFRLTGRHNEIWILKKDSHTSESVLDRIAKDLFKSPTA